MSVSDVVGAVASVMDNALVLLLHVDPALHDAHDLVAAAWRRTSALCLSMSHMRYSPFVTLSENSCKYAKASPQAWCVSRACLS